MPKCREMYNILVEEITTELDEIQYRREERFPRAKLYAGMKIIQSKSDEDVMIRLVGHLQDPKTIDRLVTYCEGKREE